MRTMMIAAMVGGLVVSPLLAQPDERGRRRDRARRFLVLRIAEELDLSDEKALQVSKILKAGALQRQAIRAERRALAPELQAAIDAADEARINALVDKARAMDRKKREIVAESFDEIGALLSPVERGKLALLMPQIQDQVRGRGRGRGRRGGGERRSK